MPELNVVHVAIIAVMTVIGAIVGWVLRGNRSQEEKAAVSAGWQEQINAQRTEHDRLTDQNKALMEQISQYQASNIDAKNRARELSEAVQEAYTRRDELQREIKDIRGNLEVAMTERDQLQSDMNSKQDETASAQRKDARINKLQLELDNWQSRLPPLIERFRQKNADAEQLQADLTAAEERIAELEESAEPNATRIEPVSDPDTLTDGRDASNDPIEDDIADEGEQSTDEPVNAARDNLQAIKGVGPAIEKTLNELGIFRFQQIADMSEYDIDRVAKRLKGFRSRIYREDWTGQARELRDQNLGD
jgi:predicted flap endonuclease-1-like 5' DNA nuclease